MATIRAYTTIEQSRKLAEILPLESADMCYLSDESLFPKVNYNGMVFFNSEEEKPSTIIPCWSLAALLSLIPEVSLNTFNDGKWNAMIQSDGKMIYTDKDNPVDACYEMIIRLNELKVL